MTEQLSTGERARGRWREILPRLGVDARFLKKKHGPCPLCGGRDRFRFDDKGGNGSYYCNQCGPGVGIILVRKRNGWDHKTACDEIDKIIGNKPQVGGTAPRPKSERSRLTPIEQLLAEANEQSVVTAYLHKRGLRDSSAVLRGHPRCPYFDDDGHLIGRFPAVVAPVTAPNCNLESAIRIYDTDHIEKEKRKKLMPAVRTINGTAVRLHDAGRLLGVGEGVETALAGHELFQVPAWAALNENGIKTFEPPPGTERLLIFGDNDLNFVGQDAAYALARRIAKTGIAVEVHIPPDPDSDWLDVLNQMNGRYRPP